MYNSSFDSCLFYTALVIEEVDIVKTRCYEIPFIERCICFKIFQDLADTIVCATWVPLPSTVNFFIERVGTVRANKMEIISEKIKPLSLI